MNEQEATQKPVISFKGADILNGETPVIYGLDMEVFPGQLVYIIGKVGTGKTSIIRTMTAENRLGGGSATVCGYDLSKIRPKEIPYLRRRLGVVFQDFQLLMDRTVWDNLKFVLQSTGWKDRDAMVQRISAVLEAVGMLTKAHKMPHQLSGGEQQRIAIARAILNEPELIIADEPTGNLDSETAEEILQLMRNINREKGTAIVMVTHNRSICERFRGRIFETRDEACTEITPSEESISIYTEDFESDELAEMAGVGTDAAGEEAVAAEEAPVAGEAEKAAEAAGTGDPSDSEDLACEGEEAASSEIAGSAIAPETSTSDDEVHSADPEGEGSQEESGSF